MGLRLLIVDCRMGGSSSCGGEAKKFGGKIFLFGWQSVFLVMGVFFGEGRCAPGLVVC
jgi:hypothetical protein